MKSYVLCLLGLFLLSPMAWGQATGGGGSNSGGLRTPVHAIKKGGCEEGRQSVFYVSVGDHMELQTRVCKDGSYMSAEERAAYIYNPNVQCSNVHEGKVLRRQVRISKDKVVRKPFLCENGLWIDLNE